MFTKLEIAVSSVSIPDTKIPKTFYNASNMKGIKQEDSVSLICKPLMVYASITYNSELHSTYSRRLSPHFSILCMRPVSHRGNHKIELIHVWATKPPEEKMKRHQAVSPWMCSEIPQI